MELVTAVRIAAVLDCEGWITISKINNSRGIGLCLTIGVGNTNSNLTDWLKSEFGGSVYMTKRAGEKHKDYYTWRVFGNRASEILRAACPYMLLKQAQANLALTFQEKVHSKNSYNEPCTPEYVAAMQALKYQLSVLNRKGKLSPAETERDNTSASRSEATVRTSTKVEETSRNVPSLA